MNKYIYNVIIKPDNIHCEFQSPNGFSFYQGLKKICDEIESIYNDTIDNLKYISEINISLSWQENLPELKEHIEFPISTSKSFDAFEKFLCDSYINNTPEHQIIKSIKLNITTSNNSN